MSLILEFVALRPHSVPHYDRVTAAWSPLDASADYALTELQEAAVFRNHSAT
jgi:hypothetical protein